jgi:hypothetical protein
VLWQFKILNKFFDFYLSAFEYFKIGAVFTFNRCILLLNWFFYQNRNFLSCFYPHFKTWKQKLNSYLNTIFFYNNWSYETTFCIRPISISSKIRAPLEYNYNICINFFLHILEYLGGIFWNCIEWWTSVV